MVELSYERLYLSKDSKQDIYVDKCPLVQHQLDGIRFLYKALKKKKQAVILNDPSGYGKRVQTALFLSAVLPTLVKPVLILCREGKEQQWMSCFQQWTQVTDDVTIELSNPFAKTKVLISASYGAGAFARRHWSVLVVDDDLSKEVQKSSLRADLRIWITSSIIKNDLAKFCTFHSWVHPKEKFLADKYKANMRDLSDVLLKTAMLDALLEDTVLRRDCGGAPFTKTPVQISNKITETRTKTKNKDATGTKIKRSKRISTVNTEIIKDITTKVAKTSKTENTTEINTEVFDIGVIGGENKTETKNTKDYEMADKSDSLSPLRRNKKKQSNTLWDSEDSDEVTNLQEHKYSDSEMDDSGEQLKALRWDSDSDSEHCRKDTSQLDVNEGQSKTKLNAEPSTRDDETYPRVEEVDVIDEQNNGRTDNKQHENNEIIDSINPMVNEHNKFSEDLFSADLTTNPNEIIYVTECPADKVHTSHHENEQSTKITESNENTDQEKPENVNVSSFDVKMKQLEELALKKYKGSFLDNMFSRVD